MLATEYAQWHGIAAQREGESDAAFMDRVSGELRNQGCIIEAHAVSANKRFDEEGSDAMTGIFGAMAMALQGKDYGSKGSTLVGDEIAAGLIAKSPKRNDDPLMALLALALFDRG